MTPVPVTVVRDLRLDLVRGLSLWLIFLDHIPSNILSWLTIRNYGFSDAAEIFVFVSGYANAYFYGQVVRQGEFFRAAIPMWRRAWQLYAAQILLFVFYVGLIVIIAGDRPHYLDQTNIARFLEHPGTMMLKMLLLEYKPLDLDPLPLYFLFMAVFPPVLWLLIRLPKVALLSSVLLYFSARHFDWNLPAVPDQGWYFNPFAWQLLFVLGAGSALAVDGWLDQLLRSRVITVIAGLYLFFAFLTVMTWNIPSLGFLQPKWLMSIIYPIDKSTLDPLRLLHFLALAAITVRFVPCDAKWLRLPAFRPMILCGQHSLEIFSLGVLLSFVGHFATLEISGSVWMQFLVSVFGILAMITMATISSWGDKVSTPIKVVSPPPL
jgi:hypothetical protein